MNWDGGIIGWQSNASNYESHPLSGEVYNDDIDCLYSDVYSAIVYRLSTCLHIYVFLVKITILMFVGPPQCVYPVS